MKTTDTAKYRKEIAGFRIIDDFFMNIVFHERPLETSELLKIILGRDDITVTSSISQSLVTNTYGHSARFDIKAVDDKGKIYDIEIQRANKGASEKRARYYSSMIDFSALEKGKEDFNDLPETYVIMICEHDYFKMGKPIYIIDRYIGNCLFLPFNDQQHIIYVNGAYRNTDDPIGKLIHDLFQTDYRQIINKVLAKRVKYLKEEKEDLTSMCEAIERLMNETEEKTRKQDHEETAKSAVEFIRSLSPSADNEEIVNCITKYFNIEKEYIEKYL